MRLEEELALIQRAYELRRAGRFGVILADEGRLYVCGSESEPRETRRRVYLDRLRRLVEEAERRPIGRETERNSPPCRGLTHTA
jgi:hypothetical protein